MNPSGKQGREERKKFKDGMSVSISVWGKQLINCPVKLTLQVE